MSVDLAGRPIAITGATSGIGRAAAFACAAEGMPVAVSGLREDALAQVAGEIRRAGGRAVAVRCDVDDPAQCEALVARTAEAFGGVYAVFANAGFGADSPVHTMSDAGVRAIFETNFFGTLNTLRAALPRLLANEPSGRGPRGHALICSSSLARVGLPHLGVYAATKAAQAHVAAAMRVELAASGVEVTSVHPVGTATNFFRSFREVNVGEAERHKPPKLFTQTPEAVARYVVAGLRRPRPEIWTGWRGWVTRMTGAAMTASPGFGDFVRRGNLPKPAGE